MNNLIEVWHFSPQSNLSILSPMTPKHPEYADFNAVYLSVSIDYCKFWADVMAKEKYHKPPFYIYRGVADIYSLHKITLNDNGNFSLSDLDPRDLEEIDQVLYLDALPVDFYQMYLPC